MKSYIFIKVENIQCNVQPEYLLNAIASLNLGYETLSTKANNEYIAKL